MWILIDWQIIDESFPSLNYLKFKIINLRNLFKADITMISIDPILIYVFSLTSAGDPSLTLRMTGSYGVIEGKEMAIR